MKTFKLKSLKVLEDKDRVGKKIPLLDGLIINREDEESNWLIEAYVNNSYFDYFNTLHVQKENIVVQVKITKESNEPATFTTSIIGVNKIGNKMNVLLLGKIIDKRKDKIEEMLNKLINEGYQGDELAAEFKKLI